MKKEYGFAAKEPSNLRLRPRRMINSILLPRHRRPDLRAAVEGHVQHRASRRELHIRRPCRHQIFESWKTKRSQSPGIVRGFSLWSRCLFMAQSGHFVAGSRCPLSGVKRTSFEDPAMSAFDPKPTWAPQRKIEANDPRGWSALHWLRGALCFAPSAGKANAARATGPAIAAWR